MSTPAARAPVLVCFAVPQEAKAFQKLIAGREDVRALITGMGARNAERAVGEALNQIHPTRVFTCGFAGALHPDLKIGEVVCSHETPVAGAKPVTFFCAPRVAITVAEKSALRTQTGADAVEMESAVIARVCRAAGVECMTLRAISDTAHEDLPLDFNALMTPEMKLSPAKLALAILGAPQKIPALLRLGKSSALAAARLAEILDGIVRLRGNKEVEPILLRPPPSAPL
jgi:adenosylhomocysteine nucleosidase